MLLKLSLMTTPMFQDVSLTDNNVMFQDVIVAIRDCAFVTSGMSKNTVLSG
jgi:hypothetical protein